MTSQADLGERACEIVGRLSAVGLSPPAVDREGAERALADYYRALGLPPSAVVWAEEAQSAYRPAHERKADSPSRRSTRRASCAGAALLAGEETVKLFRAEELEQLK